MHRVVVKPFATPNELMAFKHVYYFEGDTVFPIEFTFSGLRPEPVISKTRIEINCRAECMHRRPICFGNDATVIGPLAGHKVTAKLCRQLRPLARNGGKLLSNPIHRSHLHGSPTPIR